MVQPAIIFATRNAHKLSEVRAILSQVLPDLDPALIGSAADLDIAEPVEDGVTFAANALIKARQIAQLTGIPACADDSGICVDVLGGAPGIFSARWAGRHGDDAANLDLLLAQLSDVPSVHRGAQFRCAAALVVPGAHNGAQTDVHTGAGVRAYEHVEEGVVEGTLRYERAGVGGFGYDPIFEPRGYTCTLAEIPTEHKNAISHRRLAFEALAEHIAAAVR